MSIRNCVILGQVENLNQSQTAKLCNVTRQAVSAHLKLSKRILNKHRNLASIIFLLSKGYSIKETAKELKIHYQLVRYYVKTRKLKRRKSQWGKLIKEKQCGKNLENVKIRKEKQEGTLKRG